MTTTWTIVNNIKNIFSQSPVIRCVRDGNVYNALNGDPNLQYPFFLITPSGSNISENYISRDFTVYIVDRIDDLNVNALEVQSNCELELINGLSYIDVCDEFENDEISTGTITYFSDQFKDRIAGIYCTITVNSPKDNCWNYGETSDEM